MDSVTIVNNAPYSGSPSNPSFTDTNIQVTLASATPGQYYTLKVAIPPNYRSTKAQAVTVQTSNTNEPSIQIPVREETDEKESCNRSAPFFCRTAFKHRKTQMRLDLSTRYDFGKVLAGTISIRHDFTFTNVGSTTLEITSAEPPLRNA